MSERADERVVVTGIGVIAPNGNGLDAFRSALREGRSGVRHQPVMQEQKFANLSAPSVAKGPGVANKYGAIS